MIFFFEDLLVDKEPSYKLLKGKISTFLIDSRLINLHNDYPIVGIDPGNRNMGITIILPPDDITHCIVCTEVKMEPEHNPAIRPIDIYGVIFGFLHQWYEDKVYYDAQAVIEGASFGDKYRQVELAEARTAALFALDDSGIKNIQILPPISIRKQVFGTGKTRGEDVWKHLLPPNAASSLVCALCGCS